MFHTIFHNISTFQIRFTHDLLLTLLIRGCKPLRLDGVMQNRMVTNIKPWRSTSYFISILRMKQYSLWFTVNVTFVIGTFLRYCDWRMLYRDSWNFEIQTSISIKTFLLLFPSSIFLKRRIKTNTSKGRNHSTVLMHLTYFLCIL